MFVLLPRTLTIVSCEVSDEWIGGELYSFPDSTPLGSEEKEYSESLIEALLKRFSL
jgi:hypothetical protein